MKCEHCHRDGQLTCQYVIESKHFGIEPFVFRYYLCRYHRASANRRPVIKGAKTRVIEYVEDEKLLKEYAERAIKNNETACV